MSLDELWTALRLLLLLAVANTAPLVAKRLFGARWSTPLDGGLGFLDGRPLLGASKTVRGLVAATLASALAAPLLGLPAAIGAVLGVGAMLGDALASFTKRRLGTPPSGRATGLDQIPEALLPLLLLQATLDLGLLQIAAVTLTFFVLEIPLAWLAHRLGLRDQPY
ncbi:CDP-archaeol synthase [Rhodoferax sp. BAB1]|uniref:CDP-archaeol synthase n=1 Tax=Rhodoferax sp. BAB1 TaxID=2741720 RepID=UPI001577708A|nr:CDP-archaeol synthase [Rhodoferax sp. BAB1]QKO22005.1 CDP-archaeol synthase [Rhodoferax sp. BAB1]